MAIERPSYTLTIRAPADPSDPKGIRALRWLLKRITRGAGFSIMRCEPERPGGQDDRPT